MLNVISHTIRRSEPLAFAVYWGKGPRCSLADPDMQCLDFLGAFSDRVKKGYAPGVALNLIFTDTHAELNGYSQPGIEKYFHEVGAFARERGMCTRRLGELVRVSNIAPATDLNEADIEEATLLKLIASARKWYRGSGTPEDGARTYYRMNMVERRAVPEFDLHNIQRKRSAGAFSAASAHLLHVLASPRLWCEAMVSSAGCTPVHRHLVQVRGRNAEQLISRSN